MMPEFLENIGHNFWNSQARRLFGDNGAEAATLHILADLREEGWREGVDRFPEDEREYVRMGLW